jgi:DNA (cytosine-5)-methyltransferase 1
MKMKNREHFAIDLFAGAGGLSEGIRQAGFRSIFANEIDETYALSFQANHPKVEEVNTDDIRDLNPGKIRRSLNLSKGELSLLAGGPPCQGFSINAPIRSEKDKRNHLFLYFLDFVEEFQPQAVLIENVPGMVSFKKGKTVQGILTSLRGIGYRADIRILYAAHYGVPQMRWRAIVIGLKNGDPLACFPNPTHKAPARANFTSAFNGTNLVLDTNLSSHSRLLHHTTVLEAIDDLPVLENGGGVDKMNYDKSPVQTYAQNLRNSNDILYNHKCSRLGKINLQRMQYIPVGGSWRDIPFEMLPKGLKRARRSDHTRRYGRLDPHGLATTVMTKCDPHWGTFFHYSQDRVVSVREAARIQSFPDSCRFSGSLTQQYEQVGNAVPPPLARAIAERIQACLDGEELTSLWQSGQISLSYEAV